LNKETVTVHIKYQETEQTFTGDVNHVWANVNRFFSEMIPALQIVKKALLTVDLENLIEDCKNIIAVAPEGPVLLVSKQKLTDSETLTLHLLATYIGNKLGQSKDFLTKEELQAALGKNAKITSTRLGELCREGLATKTDEGNYQITTLGIKRFQEETLPEIREKLQR
jgi:hypothetical protein